MVLYHSNKKVTNTSSMSGNITVLCMYAMASFSVLHRKAESNLLVIVPWPRSMLWKKVPLQGTQLLLPMGFLPCACDNKTSQADWRITEGLLPSSAVILNWLKCCLFFCRSFSPCSLTLRIVSCIRTFVISISTPPPWFQIVSCPQLCLWALKQTKPLPRIRAWYFFSLCQEPSEVTAVKMPQWQPTAF